MSSRREVEVFSLSFLDVLSGALGAVLFLFIVVPKNEGKGPDAQPILNITYDTTYNKFFGEIPDSLILAQAGDTLLALITDYEIMPTIKNCPPPKPCPKCPDTKALKRKIRDLEKQIPAKKLVSAPKTKVNPIPKQRTISKYKGELPSVPCKFSVEIKWEDLNDNVDLFLCKDGSCVYGGRRKNKEIGYWDSGKSKTSFWGGDLRTSQEAVRQFDQILEGDYNVYAQFKSSKNSSKNQLQISGLIYAKTDEKGELGKRFTRTLDLDKKKRTLLGSLKVTSDGSFEFIEK